MSMTDAELKAKMWFAANQSILMQRMSSAGREGQLMDGHRDIYDAAGYPKTLNFKNHYLPMYKRGGIAKRVIDAPADESWRKLPQVYEGESPEDGSTDTPFCKAWNEIAKRFAGKGLYHYLRRLDRMCGIGQFAVLYFGMSGDDDLTKPVGKGAQLRYVSVLDEGAVTFGTLVTDKSNPRFGMPETYRIAVDLPSVQSGEGTPTVTAHTLEVHHSRLLHVAEDATTNDLFGTPRLEAAYNYLVNIMKILAGSGEAAWKLMDSGNLFTTADNYELPRPGTAERKALEEQVENHWNGLSRGLLAEGLTTIPMGGTVTDPSGLININVSMVAATIDMPQRILTGSERGELASSQDSVDWLESIEERRQNHVEPMILRPCVDKFIEWGMLTAPAKGYGFKWERLVKADKTEGATVASSMANALNAMSIEVEPKEFVRVYAPDIDASKIGKKEIPAPLAMAAGGKPDMVDPQKQSAKEIAVKDLAANIADALWGGY